MKASVLPVESLEDLQTVTCHPDKKYYRVFTPGFPPTV